jgi:histone acetyltransferase MYST1
VATDNNSLLRHAPVQGQHVICAPPDLLKRLLAEAGNPGHEVDPSKIVWSKYQAEKELEKYRP